MYLKFETSGLLRSKLATDSLKFLYKVNGKGIIEQCTTVLTSKSLAQIAFNMPVCDKHMMLTSFRPCLDVVGFTSIHMC